MSKFVFAYRGGRGMATTPEGQEKVMAEWGAWFGSLGASLVDGGSPFGPAVTVRPDGGSTEGGSGGMSQTIATKSLVTGHTSSPNLHKVVIPIQ